MCPVHILSSLWEDSSMDQCQSRGELLTNSQGHWSVQIFFPEAKASRDWSRHEIHMGQWLPNLSGSPGRQRHRSIECSSLSQCGSTDVSGLAPEPSLGHFQDHYQPASSFVVVLCLSGFSSPQWSKAKEGTAGTGQQKKTSSQFTTSCDVLRHFVIISVSFSRCHKTS